jgi:hypothetical protein
MIFCAFSASSHRSGVSARAFSSARRFRATSQSKMPPQQSHGLLDVLDEIFDFCAHGFLMAANELSTNELVHDGYEHGTYRPRDAK